MSNFLKSTLYPQRSFNRNKPQDEILSDSEIEDEIPSFEVQNLNKIKSTQSTDISFSDGCYYWLWESPELQQIFVLLKKVDGIIYSLNYLSSTQIQITAKGNLQKEEMEKLSEISGIPISMLDYHMKPWIKTVVINLKNPIVQHHKIDEISSMKFITIAMQGAKFQQL